MKKLPDFKFEEPLWSDGFAIIGIDEVGRGAFAGPVAVGGVVFNPSMNNEQLTKILNLGINDSKKLTAKKREILAAIIKDECLAYSIAFIDVSIINDIGIGKATFLAMENVVKDISSHLRSNNKEFGITNYELGVKKRKSYLVNNENGNGSPIRSGMTKEDGLFALIDAFEIPGLDIPQKGIVYGDSLSISIAAASIIAKVERDKLMEELGFEFPQYGFEKHKGYGTLVHRNALKQFGSCPHHRTDYIKNSLQ